MLSTHYQWPRCVQIRMLLGSAVPGGDGMGSHGRAGRPYRRFARWVKDNTEGEVCPERGVGPSSGRGYELPMPIMHRCPGLPGQRCGKLSDRVRCPDHERIRERQRTRAKRAKRPYTQAEQERRAEAVRQWLATVGPRCPGTAGRGWHDVAPTDLTADHPDPVAAGGRESQGLSVLCRSCNSSKQHRYSECSSVVVDGDGAGQRPAPMVM